MDQKVGWVDAVASGDREPSWSFLELVLSQWEELAPPAIPFSDFAVVIAQAYRLAESFPVAEERQLPPGIGEQHGAEFFVKIGYSLPAAVWLARAGLLVIWVTFIAMLIDEAQSWNKRRGTLPPSSPESEARAREQMPDFYKFHLSINDNPDVVYRFLRDLLTPLRIATSAFRVQLLTERAPRDISALNAKSILGESIKSCFDLAQVHLGLSLITSRSRERLTQFIDSVKSRYAIELKEHVKTLLPPNENRTLVVLDPENVVVVALARLLTEACNMIDSGRAESPVFESKTEEFRQLFLSVRPATQEARDWDFSGLQDFVVPPDNLDDWPGSIPEVEELVTYRALLDLSNNRLKTSDELAIALSSDGGSLTIVIPSPACAPIAIGFPTDELRELVRTHTLITWALLPSSRRVGGQPAGFFSASLYASFIGKVRDQLDSAERQRQARKQMEGLVDLGAKGGAAAAAHGFFEFFFPGIPAAATAGLGAVAEHLLIDIAKRIVASENK
jgi:hypothetical protein